MSTTEPTVITQETARHTLWVFGYTGGCQPGTWSEKLLNLLAYAPPVHMAKLAREYPVEAAAVSLAKNDETGIEKLTKIAAGEVTG
jgi:hypothetical protein